MVTLPSVTTDLKWTASGDAKLIVFNINRRQLGNLPKRGWGKVGAWLGDSDPLLQ